MVLFSILGSILIGLGAILVVAHNWEDLGRGMRTFFAFLPVAIGQALVLFTILKRKDDRAWSEGSAIFLFLAVGACIALISQIYHIPGELDSFLFSWSLLVLPLLYVPRSIVSFMLFLGLITGYAVTYRWNDLSFGDPRLPFMYLALLTVAIPAYVKEARTRGSGTAFFWASIFLALSIAIGSQLFWIEGHLEIVLAAAGMATAYILLPMWAGDPNIRLGPFRVIGTLVMIGLLIFTSNMDVWEFRDDRTIGQDIFPLAVQILIGAYLYVMTFRRRRVMNDPLPESALVITLAYLLSYLSAPAAAILVNLWMLALGLRYIRTGTQEHSLWKLNMGLAFIGLVIWMRFFDLDINDALKGLIFILSGVGFLLMNMRQIKARKRIANA